MAKSLAELAAELHDAAFKGQVRRARSILRAGVPVDAPSGGDPGWGETALCVACGRGRTAVVQLLLEHGANPNHRNQSNWSPLMFAAASGHAKVIAMLLDYGADVTVRNDDDETALDRALDRQDTYQIGVPRRANQARERGFAAAIPLLVAAHPDGEAVLVKWQAARDENKRFWQRSFKRLYRLLEGYEGSSIYRDILRPFIPHARKTLSTLSQYREMNDADHPYDVEFWELAQLYALNRVNDFLLLGLQTGSGLDWDGPFQTREYRSYMADVGYERLCDWNGFGISSEEYQQFWSALEFEVCQPDAFHPFFHEIVDVIEDENCLLPVVEHCFWPALRFGDLLFSRSGIRVRCSPDTVNKRIAESSPIHFTFWRRRREARDLSHGWGSNSQWGTAIRRDYLSGRMYHYNVDGKYELNQTYWQQRRQDNPDVEVDGLTLADRIEFLTNRCWVKSLRDDPCSYEDRYSEPA